MRGPKELRRRLSVLLYYYISSSRRVSLLMDSMRRFRRLRTRMVSETLPALPPSPTFFLCQYLGRNKAHAGQSRVFWKNVHSV